MRKKDLVQDVSICGLKYARVLTEKIDPEIMEELKKKYSYIHIYSYDPAELPDFERRVQPTLFIDLSQSTDQIFADFNATARKHIRRGERNQDLKLKIMDNDFGGSYALYHQVKSADGARPDIKREFLGCIFFNAYWRGKMIVTMSFYDNGNCVRAKHTASLRKSMGGDDHMIAHASRGLMWEVCKWGKANGRSFFDLAGVHYDDPSKAGIRAFKESFGGRPGNVYIGRYQTGPFSALKKGLYLFGRNIN